MQKEFKNKKGVTCHIFASYTPYCDISLNECRIRVEIYLVRDNSPMPLNVATYYSMPFDNTPKATARKFINEWIAYETKD